MPEQIKPIGDMLVVEDVTVSKPRAQPTAGPLDQPMDLDAVDEVAAPREMKTSTASIVSKGKVDADSFTGEIMKQVKEGDRVLFHSNSLMEAKADGKTVNFVPVHAIIAILG